MRNVPCPSGRALPSLRSRVATPSTCRSPGLSQPCRTGRQECEDRRRLVTLGIAARYDPVLVAGCGVPEHCGPHCGSAVCAILLLTGVSDNVGGVKHVATTLPHALEQERHFALIGEVLNPTKARFLISIQVGKLSSTHASLRSQARS